MLATSAFPMTRAVEKASMALAPQPFLENVNIGELFRVHSGLQTSSRRSCWISGAARREERRIYSSHPKQTERLPLRRLHALRSAYCWYRNPGFAPAWPPLPESRGRRWQRRQRLGSAFSLEKVPLIREKGLLVISEQEKKLQWADEDSVRNREIDLAPEERSVMSREDKCTYIYIYMHKGYLLRVAPASR